MHDDRSDYDAILRHGFALLGTLLPRYHQERHDAESLLTALRPLSHDQRMLRILNSPHRVANRALGDLLLEESRACLPDDPQGSLDWARAAEAVAERYERPHPAHRISSLALQGNACRALSRFDRAREVLGEARRQLQTHPVPDPQLHADLLSFLGSLYTDLRWIDRARNYLRASAVIYRRLGDEHCLGRVALKLGLIHELAGDFEAALAADREALRLLSPREESALYLAAHLNSAHHHAEQGDYETARQLLAAKAERFAAEADAHTRLRVDWLRARIAAGLGEAEAAESGYLRVRERFVAHGHGFNTAIVSLHLAMLYHREHRLKALETTARQAVELSRAHGLAGESLSALLLVRRAAEARTLTLEALGQALGTLHREAQRPVRR